MMQCQDNFHTTFSNYPDMYAYHLVQSTNSQWKHSQVKKLRVEPLDKASFCYENPGAFASGISREAIEDTAENLGLALRIDGELYPLRDTAYKSLLDRAKIGGTALPKLERGVLAQTLNACLKLYSSEALALIRDEKVAAVHSGDQKDYSVLGIDALLQALKLKLDERFPENEFEQGYSDHSISSASWRLPKQKDDLLGVYTGLLAAQGKTKLADRLMPGIRFITSDTGVASAKVSALLMGLSYPIHIGGCIEVEHRHGSEIKDFDAALDQLFAQFGDQVAKLQKLMDIRLDYPVNAMTRVCKKLSVPKKAAMEAIAMYEMSYGSGPATAHDVYLAMQEILFNLKTDGTPESKLLTVEENLARALSLPWQEYDLAKAVAY